MERGDFFETDFPQVVDYPIFAGICVGGGEKRYFFPFSLRFRHFCEAESRGE